MRIQFPIWAVSTLLAALLAAGCGDSSGGSDDDGVVTKKSFVKEADTVCAKQKQEIQMRVKSSDPVKASEESSEETAPALKVELREIEAIGTPSGDAKEIEAMLKNVRKVLELVESGSNSDLLEANDYYLRATKQARSYGLKECFL